MFHDNPLVPKLIWRVRTHTHTLAVITLHGQKPESFFVFSEKWSPAQKNFYNKSAVRAAQTQGVDLSCVNKLTPLHDKCHKDPSVPQFLQDDLQRGTKTQPSN